MKIKTKAYIFITLALLGGAMFPIALKVAVDSGINIYSFIFFSYIIATTTSFALVVATGNLPKLREYMKNPMEYIKIGLVGFAFAGMIYYGIIYSEQFISATFATVIYRTQPVLMFLFIPFLLREKVTRTQVAALLLGFAGIYIAVTGGTLLSFSGTNTPVVLGLAAIVLTGALAAVLIKRYTTNMESTMFMFNSTSLVFAAVLFFFSGAHLPTFNLASTAALLYMGIPMMAGVTYLYFKGFRTLKTTFANNYYLLSPFITAVLAALLLGETIEPYYLIIAVLVAVGIAMQSLDKRGGTYQARPDSKLRNFVIFDVSGAFASTGEVAISDALGRGARVLAVKLPAKHKKAVADRVKDGGYTNVFTHEHSSITNEANFVKDVTGAGSDDMILMKVGSFDEGEDFFNDMSDLIGNESEEIGARQQ